MHESQHPLKAGRTFWRSANRGAKVTSVRVEWNEVTGRNQINVYYDIVEMHGSDRHEFDGGWQEVEYFFDIYPWAKRPSK